STPLVGNQQRNASSRSLDAIGETSRIVWCHANTSARGRFTDRLRTVGAVNEVPRRSEVDLHGLHRIRRPTRRLIFRVARPITRWRRPRRIPNDLSGAERPGRCWIARPAYRDTVRMYDLTIFDDLHLACRQADLQPHSGIARERTRRE